MKRFPLVLLLLAALGAEGGRTRRQPAALQPRRPLAAPEAAVERPARLPPAAGSNSSSPCDEAASPHPRRAAAGRRAAVLLARGAPEEAASEEPVHGVAEGEDAPKDRAAKADDPYTRSVSTTVQCVIFLVCVSTVVYTCLSISRNVDELAGAFKPSLTTQTLNVASRSVSLMPMVCMLFVGCRMYVLATTEGLGEPTPFTKNCMYLVCGGMVAQLLVVFIFAQATEPPTRPAESALAGAAAGAPEAEGPAAPPQGVGDAEDPAEGEAFDKVTGEQNDAHPVLGSAKYVEGMEQVASAVWTLQVVSMASIYCGVAGVIVGIFLYPVGTTKVSAAVLCTIAQSGAYCLAFFLLWAARSLCPDMEDGSQHGLVNAGLAMCSTMRKAPMFAVLFLAARMRALNLDPPHGLPPFWLQCCFYSTTALLILEALLAAVVGLTGIPKKAYYGVAIFSSKLKGVQIGAHVCALMTYVMLFAIFYGVYAMEDQRPRIGDEPNPKYEHRGTLSTTVHCLLLYEVAYFVVQAGQSITLLLQDVKGSSLQNTLDTLVSAGISLGLAPMFCVLFVATRMRALQLTEQMGAPPGWAQDSMYICLFATCLQSTCCLVMPIFIGSAVKVDDDGNPDYDLQPMVGAYAVTVVKYVAMLSLYGGLLLVISSIFLMDRESCMGWRDNRFITSYSELFAALLWVVLLFFVALLFSSAKVVGMGVKMAIEAADEAFLGVNIEIHQAALNLCRGYVKVEKMKVCQPVFETIWTRDEKGAVTGHKVEPEVQLNWKEDYIFKVRTLLVKVNLWRLLTSLGKEFQIQNITLTGIKVNFEKPNADMKQSNSNVEYVINYIDSLGLIPHQDENAPPPPPPPPDPSKEGKSWWTQMKADLDAVPRVLLEKIDVGDIGATVLVQNVRWLGGRDIRFAPSIGDHAVRFENIQRDVFGDKEDLGPQEMIACVVKAVGKKLCSAILSEIPNMITQRAKESAGNLLQSVASAAGLTPRSPEAGSPGSPSARLGGALSKVTAGCPRRSPRPPAPP